VTRPEIGQRRVTITFDAPDDHLLELHAAEIFLALLEHLHRHGIVPAATGLRITGVTDS
jgi:hypothetical protein